MGKSDSFLLAASPPLPFLATGVLLLFSADITAHLLSIFQNGKPCSSVVVSSSQMLWVYTFSSLHYSSVGFLKGTYPKACAQPATS